MVGCDAWISDWRSNSSSVKESKLINLFFLVHAVAIAAVPVMKQRELVFKVEVVVLVEVVEETQNNLGDLLFDLNTGI